MYKCPSCGYVGAAVVEFLGDALKKLLARARMRTKFRQRRKRKPSGYSFILPFF